METYKDGDMQQNHAELWKIISDYSKKEGEQVIQMTCSPSFDLFLYKKKKQSKHT
ncbi:hypothetical protein [Peribacillus butanolivorans]